MDATLPVDLRRFRPVVETSFRKVVHRQHRDMEPVVDSPYVAITTSSKLSPPLAATATPEDSSPVAATAEVAARTTSQQPLPPPTSTSQSQSTTQRSLKFSVENILDPTKFTGHTNSLPTPRINNNIFPHNIHHHHHHQPPHPLFNPHHAHHPWLLPVTPANLLHHHHQQQQQHQHMHHHAMDVHSTSVESEDSLYDRSSDLESGKREHSLFFLNF